ncbi:MAG: response regulator [Anaerolineae bacterium]|nr:response regulator [Anaerolineae bacterium]
MSNILVVEDVQDSAHLARKILSRSGHSVTLAFSGEEALMAASHQAIDMVILDLGLPDVDGQTLLGMLRREYNMDQIPIIVCTAWPPATAEKMAQAYGFDDFISKPYKVLKFMEVVQKNLEK